MSSVQRSALGPLAITRAVEEAASHTRLQVIAIEIVKAVVVRSDQCSGRKSRTSACYHKSKSIHEIHPTSKTSAMAILESLYRYKNGMTYHTPHHDKRLVVQERKK